MTFRAPKWNPKCQCCGNGIEPGKEFRNAGRLFCSKRCAEYDALTKIEKKAGDAFAWDVVN